MQAAYASAQQSPFNYVVAVGALVQTGRADQALTDQIMTDQTQADEWQFYTVPARFRGQSLTARGFDARRNVAVSVEVGCLGNICGGHGTHERALYFLRRDGDNRYVLQSPPCAFWIFPDPDEHTLSVVQECHDGNC